MLSMSYKTNKVLFMYDFGHRTRQYCEKKTTYIRKTLQVVSC